MANLAFRLLNKLSPWWPKPKKYDHFYYINTPLLHKQSGLIFAIWPLKTPKTANSGFGLLNKLGPLVVENPNRLCGPSGYGQGPTQPIFMSICPFFQQLPARKLERRVSLCQATQKKGRPSLRSGLKKKWKIFSFRKKNWKISSFRTKNFLSLQLIWTTIAWIIFEKFLH